MPLAVFLLRTPSTSRLRALLRLAISGIVARSSCPRFDAREISPAIRGRGCHRIEQLDARVDNSPDANEEVTVEDPGHPLYGRRFRVAFRAFQPGSRDSHVLVFYQGGVLLKLPVAALAPPTDRRVPRTKLHAEAIADLITTVRECGAWPSSRDGSGKPSPREKKSKS